MNEFFSESQEDKRRAVRESLIKKTLKDVGIPHANEFFVCSVPRMLNPEATQEVRLQIYDVLAEGKRRIVFDLCDTEYICSSGLSLLKQIKDTTRRNNMGDLHLVDPNEKIIGFIADAGMKGYFKILSTEEE